MGVTEKGRIYPTNQPFDFFCLTTEPWFTLFGGTERNGEGLSLKYASGKDERMLITNRIGYYGAETVRIASRILFIRLPTDEGALPCRPLAPVNPTQLSSLKAVTL
jgi:hypothetical protein